jgi:hypothetical protein
VRFDALSGLLSGLLTWVALAALDSCQEHAKGFRGDPQVAVFGPLAVADTSSMTGRGGPDFNAVAAVVSAEAALAL